MEAKKRGLTAKQRKLIKGIAEGKTQRQAAIDAGYSRHSADAIASRVVKKSHVSEALTATLDRVGCTDERIAMKIHALMDAKKTVSAVSGTGANAGTMDFIEVDDNPVQLAAVKLAAQLKGHFQEKVKHEHTIDADDALRETIRELVRGTTIGSRTQSASHRHDETG
jgi:phage terminase small subunit